MGDRTKIEWADASWTPIRARNLVTDKIGWHCEHASPGCVNCYSEAQNKNGFAGGTRLAFKPGHRADIELFLDEAMLTQPLRWNKPRAVFVCSMTDLFADFVTDAWIDRIFAVMALAPQHQFIVLTKRAKRMREYMADPGRLSRMAQIIYDLAGGPASMSVTWPLPSVYLGVSAERQQEADERIPDLLATPAAGRFVSIEPMLGLIDLTSIDVDGWGEVLPLKGWKPAPGEFDSEGLPAGDGHPAVNGVIVGGESGPGARPMHPGWAHSIRDQCAAAGVPFFFKQWGEWIDADHWLDVVNAWPRAPLYEADLVTPWSPPRPINYANAAVLAKVCRAPHEHQSDGSTMIRVGRARAGRHLDGVEHNDLPWNLK